MSKPIARKEGIAFAFPDVLLTPAPPSSPVPVPYPNIAQLADAVMTASTVKAGRLDVITVASEIPTSTGGEAGTSGGVSSGTFNQKCTFTMGSGTVLAEGNQIVRQLDPTMQNNGNAQGQVMVGLPTVLVGD